jgi:nickel transport protein
MYKPHIWLKVLILYGLIALIQAESPTSLSAHAVYIFAYPNGDEVCTESYFSKKDRVRNGTISMYTSDGTLIQSAQTDNDGNYCFPLPKSRSDLQFVIEAGEGHRGQFTLRAEDLPDLSDNQDTLPDSAQKDPKSPESEPQSAPSQDANAISTTLSAQEIRSIIREELKAQLGPIMRNLAEQKDDKTPGLREIVGGLGWIVGLLGIITLARGTRPKQKD